MRQQIAEMLPPSPQLWRHAWCLVLLTLIRCLNKAEATVTSEGAPYLLSAETCQAVVHESRDADFTCLADHDACPPWSSSTLRWSFVSHIFLDAVPLADGEKYGIWLPTSTNGGQYRSSLKVRGVVKDFDVGLLQCITSCGSGLNGDSSGALKSAITVPPRSIVQSVELCTLNRPTGIVFCGSSPADGQCMSAFGSSLCDKRCDSEANHYGGGSCRRSAGELLSLDGGSAVMITGKVFDGNRSEFGPESRPTLDDGATCKTDAKADDDSERCFIVVLLSADRDERFEGTTDAIAAAQVQKAMANELNTPLCIADMTSDWSLGAASSDGLVIYYLNSTLFVRAHNWSRSLVKLRFFLNHGGCQPDAFCFGETHNAAKYLANRLKLSSRLAWGANVAGVGVSKLKKKCEARYGAEEQPLISDAENFAAPHELQPMDVVSIVGLVLGISSGALLVAGLVYTVVCWRRTYGKGSSLHDGDDREVTAVASDRSLLPPTEGSQPTSLTTVSGGSECDEAQALLLRTFSERRVPEPGSVCTPVSSSAVKSADELFSAMAVP